MCFSSKQMSRYRHRQSRKFLEGFSGLQMTSRSTKQRMIYRKLSAMIDRKDSFISLKFQCPQLRYGEYLLPASQMGRNGLFLVMSIEVLGQELKDECDYTREVRHRKPMGECLKDDRRFVVARIFDHSSTSRALAIEFMSGNSP
ncbi:uncharacterized protein PGTG_22512 [Puccinia graminis f. sp. tritici CRL 75-36-700-3]|uniref:ABC1 atypical kinase-like domain-containing protein n=1 Tax=Puccinia graminis f. sp. tritici (strain CRL 75-36-700-3 / race SCCL) TaxID=418459 RepID=H6QUS7_PUCGT|nr:uncharacterized protein PGTG_22512 [Puccinia graminis f. sp. tritici CRL 75-36-700-3]EHS64835.1 hypothetical protein PGTG_22512 [Puccinia graminis f. sp. tritici CRL 75-36-700-3]